MSSKSKKGGAVLHRKVLRDAIQGITKPALHRLIYRAGGKRVSKDLYDTLRHVINVNLENLQRSATITAEYSRRKTIQSQDFFTALEVGGYHACFGINDDGGRGATNYDNIRVEKYDKIEGEPVKTKKAPKKAPKNISGVKKPHRFRPGTVALRTIKRFQKGDQFLIRKAPFVRLVREVTSNYNPDLRISKSYFVFAQYFIEILVVNILRKAIKLMIAAKRQTVMSRDVELARRISGSMWG